MASPTRIVFLDDDPVIRIARFALTDRLDALVISFAPHVYYFSAHLPGWQHHAGFILFSDGRSLLVTANEPNVAAAADEVTLVLSAARAPKD